MFCERPSFVLAVSHCPWRADRVESMKRIRPLLRSGWLLDYREITDRVPLWQWSYAMWLWAVESGGSSGATHAVFLQDDLDMHPELPGVIAAMVSEKSNRLIGLIANHPYAQRSLAIGHAWYLSSECLGSGYIFPMPLLRLFVEWRSGLSSERAQTSAEDYLITTWIHMTGRRTWHPVPAPIDTRRDIRSTNEGPAYPFQRSYARWDAAAASGRDLTARSAWVQEESPVDYGFDAGGAHADRRLGIDPGYPPKIDADMLAEHARIERAEAAAAG